MIWGYPYFRKPPYIYIYIYDVLISKIHQAARHFMSGNGESAGDGHCKRIKGAADQKAAWPTVNPPNLIDYCHKLHWPTRPKLMGDPVEASQETTQTKPNKPKHRTNNPKKTKYQKNVSAGNCSDTHGCGSLIWQLQQQSTSGRAAQFESTIVLTQGLVLWGQYGACECVSKSLCDPGTYGLKKGVQVRSKFGSGFVFSIWLHTGKNHKHNNENQNDDTNAKSEEHATSWSQPDFRGNKELWICSTSESA